MNFNGAFMFNFYFGITRYFDRSEGAPIIMYVFRHFNCQFVFAITEGMTSYILMVFNFQRGIKWRRNQTFGANDIVFHDTREYFMYFFNVGVAMAFRVYVRSSQGNVVAGRDANVIKTRVPRQMCSTFLVFFSRQVSGLVIRVQISGYRWQV